MDPFLTGVAGNMLRQQGQSYLQRGQAFMQSKMGFLSGGGLHYCFSINPEYGACGRRGQAAGQRCRAAGFAHCQLGARLRLGPCAHLCPAAPASCRRAVRTKLLMLLAPFLKRWSYVRVAEQVWALVAGGGGAGRAGTPALLLCRSPAAAGD